MMLGVFPISEIAGLDFRVKAEAAGVSGYSADARFILRVAAKLEKITPELLAKIAG
ncbi:MAG: hypothetical protein IJ766_06520 [Clostridia bacterium]|nr:hypothetical protein [Clostridia bacterium]